MPSLVLRLLVLLLAVLFQVGGWQSEAYSSASVAPAPLVADDGPRGCDAPEDSSEELSAVDDSFGSDVVPTSAPNWNSPLQSGRDFAWVDGLPPGGPPSDTPFKPPRA